MQGVGGVCSWSVLGMCAEAHMVHMQLVETVWFAITFIPESMHAEGFVGLSSWAPVVALGVSTWTFALRHEGQHGVG